MDLANNERTAMTYRHTPGELYTEERCELCGERFRPTSEVAEMYDPDNEHASSLIVHAGCGLARGFEIA